MRLVFLRCKDRPYFSYNQNFDTYINIFLPYPQPLQDRLDVVLDELLLSSCFGSQSVGGFGHFDETGAQSGKGFFGGGVFHEMGEVAGYDGAGPAYSTPAMDIDMAIVAFRQFAYVLDQILDLIDAFGHTDVVNGESCVGGVGREQMGVGLEFSFFGEVDVVTHSEFRHLLYLVFGIFLVLVAWIFSGKDVFATDTVGLEERAA